MSKSFRYPGVKPFEEEDTSVFFGRNREASAISRLIESNRLVVVHGKSGTGKSSLVKAGVLPILQDRFSEQGEVCTMDVKFGYYDKNNPQSLVRKVADLIDNHRSIRDGKELKLTFGSDASLWMAIKRLQIATPDQPTLPVIFFDQFEEMFSYPMSQIEEFMVQLAMLFYRVTPKSIIQTLDGMKKDDPSNPAITQRDFLVRPIDIRIIVAIRADRLDQLDRVRRIFPDLLQCTYLLDALDRLSAEEALIKPAELAEDFLTLPFTFNPEAVDEILTFLISSDMSGGIEGFQLQVFGKYIEKKICQRQENDGEERFKKEYRVERNDFPTELSRVIDDFYQDVIQTFGEDEREMVRILVEEELILDTTDETRRKSLDKSVALKALNGKKEILNKLLESSLMREFRAGTGSTNYELSHDSLVVPIIRAKNERINNDEKRLVAKVNSEAKDLMNQAFDKVKENNFFEAGECLMLALEKVGKVKNTEATQTEVLLNLGGVYIGWWQSEMERLNENEQRTNLVQYRESGYKLEKSKACLYEALEKAETNQLDHLGIIYEKLGVLYQVIYDCYDDIYFKEKTNSQGKAATRNTSSEFYEKALTFHSVRNNHYSMGRILENLANNFSDNLQEKVTYLKFAEISYRLGSDFIELFRIKNNLNNIQISSAGGKPWGFLLDLKTNEVFPLIKGPSDIGRTTETIYNDISFSSRYVSRRHLRMQSNLMLEDLRSLNGTAINGMLIGWGTTFPFIEEDIITLANTVALKFFTSYPNEAAQAEIPSGTWAVFITGNSHYYLTESVYLVDVEPSSPENVSMGKLRITAGEEGEGQLKIRRDLDDQPELYISEGEWSLTYTKKEGDYEYIDFIIDKEQWADGLKIPLTLSKVVEGNKIQSYGPRFEIIPLKDRSD